MLYWADLNSEQPIMMYGVLRHGRKKSSILAQTESSLFTRAE